MKKLFRPTSFWSRPRPFDSARRDKNARPRRLLGRLPPASMVWRRKPAGNRIAPVVQTITHTTNLTQTVNRVSLNDAPRDVLRLVWSRQDRLTAPGAIVSRVEKALRRIKIVSRNATRTSTPARSVTAAAPVDVARQAGSSQTPPRADPRQRTAPPLGLSYRNWAAPRAEWLSAAPFEIRAATETIASAPFYESRSVLSAKGRAHANVPRHAAAYRWVCRDGVSEPRAPAARASTALSSARSVRTVTPTTASVGIGSPAAKVPAPPIREVDLDWRKAALPSASAPVETTPSTTSASTPHATARSSRAASSPEPLRSMAQLDPSLVSRLTDDVIQRIERRARIERERRGL